LPLLCSPELSTPRGAQLGWSGGSGEKDWTRGGEGARQSSIWIPPPLRFARLDSGREKKPPNEQKQRRKVAGSNSGRVVGRMEVAVAAATGELAADRL
jgi:hypothetical protein